MTYLRTTLGLFLFGILLGFIIMVLPYGSALVLFLGFALAPWIIYHFGLRGKFTGVVAMDTGLIVGVMGCIASARLQLGLTSLVNWNQAAYFAAAALLISGTTGGVFYLFGRISPLNESSETSPLSNQGSTEKHEP
ncbi:hypothetical protein [Gimesia sp.]|uniref:hypothetical protein n=1 Tax=Gimesia sp. TaxID=2024833 RepID=UPI003A8F8447